MTRIVPANEAHDLLQPIQDTGVEPYTEASFFHEADGEVGFHGVRYTDKRTVDGITYPVSGCATRAWANLTATAPNLARTVIIRTDQVTELQKINGYKDRIIRQQEKQIKRLQEQIDNTALVNEDGIEIRVERVRKAILDEGRHPPYHRRQMGRLRQEWPALYHAIMGLVKP